MRRAILFLAFLALLAVPAFAQESEYSGGGGGGVSTAALSGTAGVIPQFVSATSIEDSKMTASGGSKGTWTLYDTGGTGVSTLVVRAGANQSTSYFFNARSSADADYGGISYSAGNGLVYSGQQFTDISGGAFSLLSVAGGAGAAQGLTLGSGGGIEFGGGIAAFGGDVGLARSAAGILAVTDGSTGQGGIGIADSATNTVSDALILRHNGGTTVTGFGTGLQFQAEAAADNNPVGYIEAVWESATINDGTRDSRLDFYGILDGAKILLMRLSTEEGGTTTTWKHTGQIILETTSGGVTLAPGGTAYWRAVGSDGSFSPVTTNTSSLGSSSLFVKDAYVATSIQGVRTEVIPSDNVAENFVQVSCATENSVTAGYIEYTVTAVDTTNEIIQTETGVVPFVAVNENTTVTSTFGTPYGIHEDNAGGAAIAVSFATSVTGTNVMMTVTSDYDQATLTGTVVNTLRYRVVLPSGTATVTPQT